VYVRTIGPGDSDHGGAIGIGAAIVSCFLREGALVVNLNRRSAATPAEATQKTFLSLVGDVRSPEDNRRAVDAAPHRLGKLDIFIGDRGVYGHKRPLLSYSDVELEMAFDELLPLNVKGYMLGPRAAEAVLAVTQGSMSFTSSISGTRPGFGGPLYVAAKHAINGPTRRLALELALRVRVNAVAPGYAPTPLRGS
jgi:2,3-dihydroxy-2,3-dihydrophenylpropionate dehydrogenase